MKRSFKIGAVSLIYGQQAASMPTRTLTHRNGIPLESPEVMDFVHNPTKNIEFNLGETQVEFECEAGELPAIYKEMAPIFSELMNAVKCIRQMELSNKRDVQKPRAGDGSMG